MQHLPVILLQRLNQSPTLVISYSCSFFVLYHVYVFTVLKAERVSNATLVKGYIFPDENDNLTAYTGGTAQVMVPSGLLQNICK